MTQPARKLGFNTAATHSGELKDPRFGNVVTPIFQTSTFVYPNYAEGTYKDHTRNEPYFYTRWGNPTLESLEKKYASLEGSEKGLSFSSGMAAIVSSIASLAGRKGRLLSMQELYGQTSAFMTGMLRGWGVETDFLPVSEINALDSLEDLYDAVYLESISNPTLQVSDVGRIGALCREKGIPLIVDATFASPYNQNPLSHGATVSVHSATKYIAGHSDVVAGLLGTDSETFGALQVSRKTLGGTPDPMQAFLVSRGIKTLGLRMEKHNRNGQEISNFLSQHSAVRRVYYPGLEENETFDVARKVLRGFGGMVSFELRGDIRSARKFISGLKLASPAPSLGGVESLVTLPIDTSHSTTPPELRRKMGISDSLIRFSLGIEDHEDLIEDMQQALSSV